MSAVKTVRRIPQGEDFSFWEGVWVLDKPEGLSSNQVLQRLRKISGVQKMGHLGTLDPIATGVLPVCIGWATKIIPFIPDHPKGYRAVMVLGAKTDTQDACGRVVERFTGSLPDRRTVEAALRDFIGMQEQTPPSYSALKYKGRPLYHWARKGVQVIKPSRVITIHSLEILDHVEGRVTFEVSCSPGTYIRTLCHDLGERLGCGAYLGALQRIQSGPFHLSQSVTLERLSRLQDPREREAYKISPEMILKHLPQIHLDRPWKEKIRQGRFITPEEGMAPWPPVDPGVPICVRGPQNELWAIYQKEGTTQAVYRPLRVII